MKWKIYLHWQFKPFPRQLYPQQLLQLQEKHLLPPEMKYNITAPFFKMSGLYVMADIKSIKAESLFITHLSLVTSAELLNPVDVCVVETDRLLGKCY